MLGYGRFETPFVGRGAEIARLDEALGRARAGDPHAVLVAGEAGVGKTRLLTEATSLAADAGMTVLVGHCVDLGEVGLPYFPFTEMLRAVEADGGLAGTLEGHPAVQRLLRPGGQEQDAGRETGVRLRLLDDVAGLLADLAEKAPVLLVVEDLHWADQSTRDLLRFLLTRLMPQRTGGGAESQRVALLVSYRSDDLHRRHPLRPLLAELVRMPSVTRMELGPMDDVAVARLVRSFGSEPVAEDTVRRIVERAEGNAFYAEELRAAATDDRIGGVPPGLADVLLTRIEQLSGTAQRVLRTAAVGGRRVEHRLLGDAVELPEEDLDSALREAVGRHLLVSDPDGTYSFRHALTREAAYRDLLPGERVRIHGMYAQLLARDDRRAGSAAERAHHHRESHDLPGALTASLEAADHAARVGAPAEELRHVESALDLWAAVPSAGELTGTDDVALMLRASAAAVRMGEAHRAVTLARAALAKVGSHADTNLAAKVRYTLASNLMSVDNLQAAYEFSNQALALIPADPPSLTWLWAATTHVQAAFYVSKLDVAQELGDRVIAVAEALGADDVRGDVMISMTGMSKENRQTEAGREKLRTAHSLARKAGNPAVELRAMFNLAMGTYEAGLLDESLRWLDDGHERARHTAQLNSPYPLEMRYLRALTLYTLGRWDDALAAAGTAPSAFGHVAGAGLYVPLSRGEPGIAERAEALFSRRPFNWMGTLVGGTVLTDEAAMRGDARAAADWARRTCADLQEDSLPYPDVGIRLAALTLGAIADEAVGLRMTGDTEALAESARVADEFIELARITERNPKRHNRTGPEGAAWLLRAEAERGRAAGEVDVESWRKAVEAFDYGNVYEHARTQLRLAEALVAVGERDEAAEVAKSVRATAEHLGAVPLRDAVDALTRRARLGDTSPEPAGSPTGEAVGTLTGREREVLALLALGRSNRQIGEELFISAKTASVHVSNILAKVGAASRTEAVALAYRKGLIAEGAPPGD